MATSDIDNRDFPNLLFYLETRAAECGREAIKQGNTIAGHQAEDAADQYARWVTWVEDQERKNDGDPTES